VSTKRYGQTFLYLLVGGVSEARVSQVGFIAPVGLFGCGYTSLGYQDGANARRRVKTGQDLLSVSRDVGVEALKEGETV
jgi:hypothetical protein